MKPSFISLFCLFLLFSCANGSSDEKVKEKDPNIKWIEDHATSIQSISPSDTDYSDLQELKNKLSDTRIIMLGEQTHGGGTTFSAKVRLVQFLHQEMGFEVLAFESGMYDCAKIAQRMSEGKPMSEEVINSLFYMYATSNEIKPLFEYMDTQKDTDNPLLLAGMDSQHTGEKSQQSMASDLDLFLTSKEANLTLEEQELFARVSQQLLLMNRATDDADKQAYYTIIEKLKSKLSSASEGQTYLENPGFWLHIVESMDTQAKRYWGDVEDMDRDRQMAENMSWLAKEYFKNKKIIIWAHNIHIAREVDAIRPMGDYLKEEFKDAVYGIGFIGYGGSYLSFISNEVVEIAPARGLKLETTFTKTKMDYAFVDLNNLTEKGAWLNEPSTIRLFDFENTKGTYPDVFDGLIYIETTIPCVRE